ncbi:AMP-binding protein [Tsukamurella sp. 1534]|uniref:AMP-binding protein n=1 Tax=Tsukamurella sp. 1534 TaxID=1151061 RepID=UPI0002F49383|nr:AMP-binding protein [Tsukamurella sp. 1534]
MALTETAREIAILQRAGLIDLRRPVQLLCQARAVGSLGPVAGPIAVGARRHPDRVAVVDGAGPVTYADLDRRARGLAAQWLGQGVTESSTVAILGPDGTPLVAAIAAAARLGARTVLLNTGFAAPQAREVTEREGATAIWCAPEFDDVAAALPGVVRLAPNAAGAAPDHELRPAAPGGLVILTGGTTGTPKGVPRRVSSPLIAAQFLDRVPLRRGERMLLCPPLFHGTAFSQFALALALGSTVVIHGRFDEAGALRQLVEHRCTSAVVVPTMLRRMASADVPAETAARIADHLRVVFCAGEALPVDVGERARSLLGPVIHNFYGTTETGTATIATPADWAAAPGTVGRPPVGVRVRVLDGADRPVRAGTVGAVFVRNPMAFDGYTDGRSKRLVDGYYDTGDTGRFDAGGRLFIEGRSDDMIVSGGENVFPGEVEEALVAHPAVEEAAVIGVPDAEFGCRLAAYVVARGPVTAEELRAHVRARLARFKVPRDVEFLDALPRTATGKVARSRIGR